MSNCNHENFDEYFGKCSHCNAPRKQVIAEEFRNELQAVYGKMQEVLGIETGDIAPEQAVELEQKEIALADAVSAWLESAIE